MFSLYHGDVVLPATLSNVPMREWTPPAARGAAPPAPQQVPLVFTTVTRDSSTGTIYVKIVNRADAPQAVHVTIGGARTIEPKGRAIVMSATNPTDMNLITDPTRLVPASTPIDGVAADFTRRVPAYSITVLQLRTR